jgi:DNA processing protein
MDSLSPRLEWLMRLNAASGLSTFAALRLWETFGPGLEKASEGELAAAADLTVETARQVRAESLAFDASKEWELVKRHGARLIACEDEAYPDILKSITDFPLLLCVAGQGSLKDAAAALAFVGTRHPTPYGRRMARALAGEAAAAGAVVVSGLARGIDSEAHEAALDARGTTWAVLGSGLARIYPPENERLARRIMDGGGCLISEWPMAAPPLKGHFPRRNRIVSGLCWGTIVVEGAARSGSLITARLAVEQGREVFAVPGPADSAQSEAPHRLIRQGAKLIRTMADVWPELPPAADPQHSLYVNAPSPARAGKAALSLEYEKILELLGPDARTLDELAEVLGIDLSRLSNIIFEMELRDLVAAVPGQRYAKKGS